MQKTTQNKSSTISSLLCSLKYKILATFKCLFSFFKTFINICLNISEEKYSFMLICGNITHFIIHKLKDKNFSSTNSLILKLHISLNTSLIFKKSEKIVFLKKLSPYIFNPKLNIQESMYLIKVFYNISNPTYLKFLI